MAQYQNASLNSRFGADAEFVLSNRPSSPKSPIWIRKSTIASFAILFIACAISLVILNHHVSTQNGLALTITDNHYSWTYGPTAILVVVLSLWRQVDYCLKRLQPWWDLSSTETSLPAGKSVLLDYISPFQVISLVDAIRNKHCAVSACIISFFLIKLIILLSTALFVNAPSLRHEHISVIYQNSFKAPKVDRFSTSGYDPWFLSSSVFLEGSKTAAWAYLATLNNASGESTFASQSIKTREEAHPSLFSSISAPVDLFVPDLVCQTTHISATRGPHDREIIFQIDTPGCRTAIHDYVVFTTRGLHNLYRVDCLLEYAGSSQHTPFSHPLAPYPRLKSGAQDIRYVVISSKWKDEFRNASLLEATSSATTCQFRYSIASTRATNHVKSEKFSVDKPDLDDSAPRRHIPHLLDLTMMELVIAALENPQGHLLVNIHLHLEHELYFAHVLFQLMAAYVGNPQDSSVFAQPSTLADSFKAVIEGVATEIAKETLLVPEPNSTGPGIGQMVQNRLFVQPVVLWIIVASFLLLASLCCLIALHVPGATAVPFPAFVLSSIASHAVVLAKSSSMIDLMKDSGSYDHQGLHEALQNTRFIASGPEVEAIPKKSSSHSTASQPLEAKLNPKLWVPLPAKGPMVILTLAGPVLVIIVLQVLQHFSDRDHGILDTDAETNHHDVLISRATLVRLASTIALFGIATLFNNLDFTITTFTPYSRLRAGNSEAFESLTFHLQGAPSPLTMFRSLWSRRNHLGTAASSMAAIIAGFLTIIGSGLWTSIPVRAHGSALGTIDLWDSDWGDRSNNITDDGGAAFLLSAIRHGSDRAPPGVWNDSVLPQVRLDEEETSTDKSYLFPTQVLRPTLDCEILPPEAISISERVINLTQYYNDPQDDYVNTPGGGYTGPFANVSVHVPGCDQKTSEVLPDLTFGLSMIDLDIDETFWIGSYHDLDDRTSDQADSVCPSIGILFGRLIPSAIEDSKGLTALICKQGINTTSAEVTYKGDPRANQMDPSHPPIIGESQVWSSTDYKLAEIFDSDLSLIANTWWTRIEGAGEMYSSVLEKAFPLGFYDAFFDNIVFGSIDFDVRSLTNLSETTSADRAQKLIEATTQSYVEYMSLYIHLNFRDSLSGAQPDTATINGTFTRNTIRLAINPPSRITLQVLLGTMTFLGIVALKLVPLRGTLPREPSSIASTMGFLAGSPRLLEVGRSAEGATTEKQLAKLFSGWAYSLGWWDVPVATEKKESSAVGSYSETTTLAGTASDDEGQERGTDAGYQQGGKVESDAEADESMLKPLQTGNGAGRFGIDVGRAAVSGFQDSKWTGTGRRLNRLFRREDR